MRKTHFILIFLVCMCMMGCPGPCSREEEAFSHPSHHLPSQASSPTHFASSEPSSQGSPPSFPSSSPSAFASESDPLPSPPKPPALIPFSYVQLAQAVFKGDLEKTREMLEMHKADIHHVLSFDECWLLNSQSPSKICGFTKEIGSTSYFVRADLDLFSIAIVGGDNSLAVAEYLLEKGGNIHSVNTAGETLLHIAAAVGTPAWINKLIRAGLSLQAPDGYGYTPLCVAIKMHQKENMKALRKAGAQLFETCGLGADSKTPFQIAQSHLFDEGQKLIQQWGGPFFLSSYVQLADAVFDGQLSKVQAMVDEQGADVNHVFSEGSRCGGWGAERPRACNFLVAVGSTSYRVQGELDLLKIAMLGGQRAVDVAQYLLKKGSKTDRIYGNNETLLHAAAAAGMPQWITTLQEKGLSLEAKNRDGETPLCLAIKLHRADNLEALLQAGANVLVPCQCNYWTPTIGTPLQCAQKEKFPEGQKLIRHFGGENIAIIYSRLYDMAAYGKNMDGLSDIAGMQEDLHNPLVDLNHLYPCYALGDSVNLLAVAVAYRQTLVLEELLKRKDISRTHTGLSEGASLLHLAARMGNDMFASFWDRDPTYGIDRVAKSIIDLLIADGVPLESVDDHGNTPLFYAAQSNHLSHVKYLLAQGAQIDPSYAEEIGCNFWTTRDSDKSRICFLLGKPADFSVSSSFDEKPLICVKEKIAKYVENDEEKKELDTAIAEVKRTGRYTLEFQKIVKKSRKNLQLIFHSDKCISDDQACRKFDHLTISREINECFDLLEKKTKEQ